MSSAWIIRVILLCSALFLPSLQAAEESEQSSWSASVDFLAWLASEDEASIWADVITIGKNTSTWKAQGFRFKWDYGFRLGIGHDLPLDQWDTMLYWTYFRTEAKHRIPAMPNAFISQEPDAGFLSGDRPQSMSGKWSILLNMFDWEFGRKYWISNYLSLRPFLGLKGGWINQSLHVHYHNLTINSVLTQNSGREHLKNNFWGIGPLGGINTLWKVRDFRFHCFNFFGDFSMATLWGTWDCGDVYKNSISHKFSVNTKKSTLGALMFRGFLGIGWDLDIHANRFHFSTKLGYEMQLWLDQLRIATFQLQRLHNDLTLQGVTWNVRFDF